MADRGQTETLGFVLVFGLVVAVIGVTFATGFSGLQDVREVERLNNAERAFEVLADNLEDIVHRNAPRRATEIKVSDARLGFADPVTVDVSIDGAPLNWTFQVDPLAYEAEAGEIVYSTGAVLRHDGSGSGLVASESTFLLGANRTIVPIIQTRAGESSGVGGSTTVLIRTEVSDRRVLQFNGSGSTTVWLNATTPRAAAWRSHFSADADVTCEPLVDQTVACQVTTDRLLVTLTRVDVEIS